MHIFKGFSLSTHKGNIHKVKFTVSDTQVDVNTLHSVVPSTAQNTGIKCNPNFEYLLGSHFSWFLVCITSLFLLKPLPSPLSSLLCPYPSSHLLSSPL